MVHRSVIQARLSQLGVKTSYWFQAELRELEHVLMDHENVVRFACGRYFGGFAILVATDQRLLLIDKKFLFLTVEDIRFDMISEIDYNSRLFESTITIFTLNKQHVFKSMKHKHHLRSMSQYLQQRVMELRQQYQHPQHPQQQQYMQPMQPNPGGQFMSINAPAPTPAVSAPMQMHPPTLEHISSVPSAEVPQLVGSTAIQGANWGGMNPYLKAPLMMRRNSSPYSSPYNR